MNNVYNQREQLQAQRRYPFERFASVRSYTGFDFLKKDPSWLIYIVDINGQFNIWRQRSSLSSDGEPYASYQLTNFIDDPVRHVFTSPVDNSIIFFADRQGTENFQIYKIDDAFYSWPERITQNSKIRHEWGAECFSHSGKYIAYGSNEENPSNMLVYVKDITNNISSSGNETFCITNKEGWYIPGYWSPDNKKLNCSQLVTLTDYIIWLLNIENGEMVKVIPSEYMIQKGRFTVGPWSPDGKGFYIISDLEREFANLAFYDIDKVKLEWILTPQHDIELVDLSFDGTTLAWTENIDGYSSIFTKNLKNGQVEEITNLSSNGVIEDLKLSPDGKRIGIMMTTPTSPSDIYVLDIDKTTKEDYYNQNKNKSNIQKLSYSFLGNIPENALIKPDLIKYNSFDGLEISAFLYKPKEEDSSVNNKSMKFGAILSVHGGPTAQERPLYDYSGLYQYLANNRLVVIAPNFRGSTGYGKSFEKKIYHDWGGDELNDIEYAIKWLKSQDWIDAHRIGVFGASFGGFAILSCVTRLPQYNWKAAVDIVGPSNLVTFAKAVPEHWKRFMGELVGDPEKEEDFLKQRSPITYVDFINPTTSLLVIQGANDPRVVKNESDQIVEKLKSKNFDVEYMVFEDEGHGFTKYSNLVRALKKSAEFLVEKLSIR
jgi:Tol biopolymer transport system component/dienelactone hydrolase